MIRKRVIQIVSVLLVMLITVTAIPMYFSAEGTKDNKLYFYTTYDENGNQIRSTKQVGALHKNLAEDMFKINDKRAYCIELNTPANSSDTYVVNTGSASSVWKNLSNGQQTLIRNIICLGLEGNSKGSATTKTVNGHKIDFYTMEVTVKENGKTKTKTITTTVHELYIATQLMIWEVTEGYRSTSRSAKFKSRYDLSEAYNANVRGVYRGIVLTYDNFQGNKKYVTDFCNVLNDYFKSCGAVINPKLKGRNQYLVTTSDSFLYGDTLKGFLAGTVNIWTCQRAKDAVEQEGWKNFHGEGMRDDPKFIDFLDECERIAGNYEWSTYNPDKMLDPKWNGWKQWFNTGLKVNVYVYVHQKDVLDDGSISYEIRMCWGCL